jgi:hypothetical protein
VPKVFIEELGFIISPPYAWKGKTRPCNSGKKEEK